MHYSVIASIFVLVFQNTCTGQESIKIASSQDIRSAVDPDDFPQIVGLGFAKSNYSTIWYCTGSLINERYVLTAAHCLSPKWGQVNRIRLGDLSPGTDTESVNNAEFNVKRYIKYPGYKADESINDIGLVELDRSVDSHYKNHLACLPYDTYDKFEDFIAVDWAGADSGEPTLYKEVVQLHTDEYCENFTRELQVFALPSGINSTSQLCASSAASDPCQRGDSGGPLLAKHSNDSCTYFVVGVTSIAHGGCSVNDYPVIYTRVFQFVDWIRTIIYT